MKIQLIDHNKEMCEQWNLHFKNCDDVIVYSGIAEPPVAGAVNATLAKPLL